MTRSWDELWPVTEPPDDFALRVVVLESRCSSLQVAVDGIHKPNMRAVSAHDVK